MGYRRKVQYYETDKMGVTHHSNYLRWMEETRIDFLNNASLPYDKMEENGIISPVVSVNVEYKSPTTFADEVEIEIWIEKYNGIKLCFGYEIKNLTNGRIAAKASSSHCFIKDGRVVSVMRELPEVHEKLSAIPVKE